MLQDLHLLRWFTHTQLCHTHNLSHNFVTQLCHTQVFHSQPRHTHTTIFHKTRNFFMRNSVTHSTFTYNVQLFHTHTHATLSHTHTRTHTHTHAHTHAQLWHLVTSTLLLRGRRCTCGIGLALVGRLVACGAALLPGSGNWWRWCCFCVAGMALGDIYLAFAWQAWPLWRLVGSGGALGRKSVALTLLFAWQAWRLVTSTLPQFMAKLLISEEELPLRPIAQSRSTQRQFSARVPRNSTDWEQDFVRSKSRPCDLWGWSWMITCGLRYAWTWVLDCLQHLQDFDRPVDTIKMQRCGGDSATSHWIEFVQAFIIKGGTNMLTGRSLRSSGLYVVNFKAANYDVWRPPIASNHHGTSWWRLAFCPWKPLNASHWPTTFLWVEPGGIREPGDAPSKVLDFQAYQKTAHLPDCWRAEGLGLATAEGALNKHVSQEFQCAQPQPRVIMKPWGMSPVGIWHWACSTGLSSRQISMRRWSWQSTPKLRRNVLPCNISDSFTMISTCSVSRRAHVELRQAALSCPACTWSPCRPAGRLWPMQVVWSLLFGSWQRLPFCPRIYEQAVMQATCLRWNNAHPHCRLESHIPVLGDREQLLRRTWLGCCTCMS